MKMQGHTSIAMQLNSMEQEVSDDLLLKGVIYKDDNLKNVQIKYNHNVTTSGVTNDSSSRHSGNGDNQPNHVPNSAGGEDKKQESSDKKTGVLTIRKPPSRSSTAKIWEMEDQLVMAKAYVHFSSSNSNSHLVRELKLRIKEIDRVLSHANKDSDLFTSDLQKMKNMEATLSKARIAYPECSTMASKLRAQLFNAKELLRAQQNQASYLVRLTGRTFPRGFHCLSMHLTTEYFEFHPDLRKLPNSHNFDKPDLYHFAIFSDNVLACSVVVKSTVNSSLGSRHLWKAGSLPLGQLLFYNYTVTLDKRWHIFRLGSDLSVGVTD